MNKVNGVILFTGMIFQIFVIQTCAKLINNKFSQYTTYNKVISRESSVIFDFRLIFNEHKYGIYSVL